MPIETPRSTPFGVGLPLKEARLQFRYLNWHNVEHAYVIDVESVEFGPYDEHGWQGSDVLQHQWVLHGHVVSRDGHNRAELGFAKHNRRRTFLMKGMIEVELI